VLVLRIGTSSIVVAQTGHGFDDSLAQVAGVPPDGDVSRDSFIVVTTSDGTALGYGKPGCDICPAPPDPNPTDPQPPGDPRAPRGDDPPDLREVLTECFTPPPNVDVTANAALALAAKADAEHNIPEDDQWFVYTFWFVSHVQPYGPWDYKRLGTNDIERNDYRNFGNYNFGYVGTALALSRELLHGGAGILQMLQLKWKPSFGYPFVDQNMGDSPPDYWSVERGIRDRNSNKVSICR
jgi:putative RNase toxin 44 of polymorphic toxin system